jgi:hypothetical protein
MDLADTVGVPKDGTDALNLFGGALAKYLGGPWGQILTLAMPTIAGLLGNKGEDLLSMRRRAQAMLDPSSIQNETNSQMAALLASPAYAAARMQAVQGGQVGAQAINARLAQTGLGRSGVGLAMEGAMRAAPDIQMAKMTGMLQSQAADRALQIQQMRADAIMRGGPVNSMARDMFGATIAALLPQLLNMKIDKKDNKTGKDDGKDTGGSAPADATRVARPTGAGYVNNTVGPVIGGTTIPLSAAFSAPKSMGNHWTSRAPMYDEYNAAPGPQAFEYNKPYQWTHKPWFPTRPVYEQDQPVYKNNYDWARRTGRTWWGI